MSHFIPGFSADPVADPAYYVVLLDQQHVLAKDDPLWQPIDSDTWRFCGLRPDQQHYIGEYNQTPCFAVKVLPDEPLPPGYRWESLRNLMLSGAVGDAEFAMVGCGMQVFNWDRSHQYCGQCGTATSYHERERARVCETCGIHYYPRLSPCVIVLVTREDHCLLARHQGHRGQWHSPLAGFIEPGESIEGALHREVAEEVSIQVNNVRYFASQPWPFPGQLMIGFYADYHSGELAVDGVEIAEANWWHFKDLPLVPRPGSLSGRLIQQFVEQCKQQE